MSSKVNLPSSPTALHLLLEEEPGEGRGDGRRAAAAIAQTNAPTSAARMPAADCQGEHGVRRRMGEDFWGAKNASCNMQQEGSNKRAAAQGLRIARTL
jgi:hypothetical protein